MGSRVFLKCRVIEVHWRCDRLLSMCAVMLVSFGKVSESSKVHWYLKEGILVCGTGSSYISKGVRVFGYC
jgi:hypothetical protein